jgi:hypothetical protein
MLETNVTNISADGMLPYSFYFIIVSILLLHEVFGAAVWELSQALHYLNSIAYTFMKPHMRPLYSTANLSSSSASTKHDANTWNWLFVTDCSRIRSVQREPGWNLTESTRRSNPASN